MSLQLSGAEHRAVAAKDAAEMVKKDAQQEAAGLRNELRDAKLLLTVGVVLVLRAACNAAGCVVAWAR